MPQLNVDGRHPGVQEMAQWFDYEHLRSPQREFSQQVYDLAANMLHDLPDSAELTAGLRKLLEAKDCFVRASMVSDPRSPEDRAAERADELQEGRKRDIRNQSQDVNQYFDDPSSAED